MTREVSIAVERGVSISLAFTTEIAEPRMADHIRSGFSGDVSYFGRVSKGAMLPTGCYLRRSIFAQGCIMMQFISDVSARAQRYQPSHIVAVHFRLGLTTEIAKPITFAQGSPLMCLISDVSARTQRHRRVQFTTRVFPRAYLCQC